MTKEKEIIKKVLEMPIENWGFKPDKFWDCWFAQHTGISIFLFDRPNYPFAQVKEVDKSLEIVQSNKFLEIINTLKDKL